MSENQKERAAVSKRSRPDDETLHRLFCEEGKTQEEISDMYNVAISTVRLWICNARKRNPKLFPCKYASVKKTAPDIDTLKRLYSDEGKSYREIAKIYDVSRTLAMQWIHDANNQGARISTNKHQIPNDETLHRLAYDEGKSTPEIAEIYNVSCQTVVRWIMQARKRNPEVFPKRQCKDINALTIKRLFIDEEKTAQEIAEMYSVKKQSVYRWLGSARKKNPEMFPYKIQHPTCKISVETLKSLYIDQNLTAKEIAEIYNVTPPTVVHLLKLAQEKHPEINLRKRKYRKK